MRIKNTGQRTFTMPKAKPEPIKAIAYVGQYIPAPARPPVVTVVQHRSKT